MWEQNPQTYLDTYFAGKRMGTNRSMALGKEIADAMENETDTGDFTKDFVLAQLKAYEIRDKEILCPMKLETKEVLQILIKPDTIKEDYSALVEYKTGREDGASSTKWTQKKVDEDEQLTFYATGVYILTKKIPEIELQWAPTRYITGEDGIERPELTGEVRTFKTVRSISHVLRMIVRMKKAWREIGEACEAELL